AAVPASIWRRQIAASALASSSTPRNGVTMATSEPPSRDRALVMAMPSIRSGYLVGSGLALRRGKRAEPGQHAGHQGAIAGAGGAHGGEPVQPQHLGDALRQAAGGVGGGAQDQAARRRKRAAGVGEDGKRLFRGVDFGRDGKVGGGALRA